MNFSSIPAGAAVFLDGNVLVYAFGFDPVYGPPCKTLLNRIEQGDLAGFMSTHAFSDAAHRMMTLEACQTLGWPYAGVTRRLRRHPGEIQNFKQFRKALDDIVAMGVQILPIVSQHVLLAGDMSIRHGLLSGDALILAVMQDHGLTNLASNDADFDRIPGITRYDPV